jgi:pyridoxine 5'-phosphate synthase PdxJ
MITLAHIAVEVYAAVMIAVITTIFAGATIAALHDRRDRRRKQRADVARVRALGQQLTDSDHFGAWERQLKPRARGFARGRV